MMPEKMKYVIVKHGGETWPYYWPNDPKIVGVSESDFVCFTNTGKLYYRPGPTTDKVSLEKLKDQMNSIDPTGDYDICHVKR